VYRKAREGTGAFKEKIIWGNLFLRTQYLHNSFIYNLFSLSHFFTDDRREESSEWKKKYMRVCVYVCGKAHRYSCTTNDDDNQIRINFNHVCYYAKIYVQKFCAVLFYWLWFKFIGKLFINLKLQLLMLKHICIEKMKMKKKRIK
jgi:hypothetical protein